MKQGLFAAAIALALVSGTAGISYACGSWYVIASPAPGGDIAATGPIVLRVSRTHPFMLSLAERGPVLKSDTDEVPLQILEEVPTAHGLVRVVLVPARPLIAGRTYALAVTRTRTGFGLNRADVPIHGLAWTARDAGELAPAILRAADADPRQPSLLARLAVFGVLPFFAGFAGVAGLLAVARRRALARIERLQF